MLLKLYCDIFARPLEHLINYSFQSGVFPSTLKLSIVKPLHKKGEVDNLDNFRPISITSTFSKVFERAVLDRLWTFISQHNILFNNQFGFVRGGSTVRAMFTLLNKVVCALDRGMDASGVFFDLRKAFDMVPHEVLLGKLDGIGVRGVAKQWFSSYLRDRKQVVEMSYVDGVTLKLCRSDVQTVMAGVPQGSILGPLLFILYINDLRSCVPDAHLCLFADDTSIIMDNHCRSLLEVNTFVNSNRIVQWFQENGLVINTDKTNLLDFSITGKRDDDLSVWVGDVEVFSQHSVKFLGLSVDRNLNFYSHINNVARKVCSGIFVLRTLSQFTNSAVLLTTYYALILPYLSYAVTIWGSERSLTKRIFVLQKRALRIVAGIRQRESCKNIFQNLNVLTFPSIYIFHTLIFFNRTIVFFSLLFHSQNTT